MLFTQRQVSSPEAGNTDPKSPNNVGLSHTTLLDGLFAKQHLQTSDLPKLGHCQIYLRCAEAGVPVRLMSSSESDIKDVVRASSNVVWAAREQMVRGLKRKVVVVLDSDEDSKVNYAEEQQRLMSRCTSQLVLVCLPGDDSD